MKSVLLLCLLVGLSMLVQAQQSINETMGFYNGRENTIPAFEAINGFDQDGLTYSGSGTQGVYRLNRSSGYAGASGYPLVYMTASQTFIVKGLTPSAPCNSANTIISFGVVSSLASTSITVSYSSDNGTTWIASSPTPVTNSWLLQSVSVPGNTNAIRFQTPNLYAFVEYTAIDDVTIGNDGVGCALPVRLRTFGGQDSQLGVQLNWTTEMESGNSHFLIERSTDAKAFEAVGRREGFGDSQELRNYTYLDESAHSGVNYYRLKQVDLSGEFSYSSIIAVRFEGLGLFRVYPNPTTALLTLTLPKGAEAKTIQLYNATGQLLTYWLPSQPVSLASVANGRYLVRVYTTDGRIFSQWVIKAD